MSAIAPSGRTAEPAGAGGNDALPPSVRLTRNPPATPPRRAATMAIASAAAAMAEIAPALRRRSPLPWRGGGISSDVAADGSSAGGGLGYRKGHVANAQQPQH